MSELTITGLSFLLGVLSYWLIIIIVDKISYRKCKNKHSSTCSIACGGLIKPCKDEN